MFAWEVIATDELVSPDENEDDEASISILLF